MNNEKYRIDEELNLVMQLNNDCCTIDPMDLNGKCFRCGEGYEYENKIGDKGVDYRCPKCGLIHSSYHY